MSARDWRWKLGEAAERLRTRYDHIGRKTAAPFLAVVYPVEAQTAVLAEWHTQVEGLRPAIDVRSLDLLEITQGVVAEIGAKNVLDTLQQPMPGSYPRNELGTLWVKAITEAVRTAFLSAAAKPAVSLERCAALYPVMGPRELMQALWGGDQDAIRGPVLVLIPGTIVGSSTYEFLDIQQEFMYRGDLL